jgi:hypothetical protein
MSAETLAHNLGTTTHVSPLLMKARRLGLSGAEDLCTLTVQRGCRHYWQGHEQEREPLLTQAQYSNEELAIALLSIAGRYDPHAIRCGAAMLGAEGNKPETLVRLARWERSEQVVRYIAECGIQFEATNAFWSELLNLLPKTQPPKEGVMPHPTRFVAMNGFERGIGKKVTTEWQRPQRTVA